jgi:hypothetical protein
LGRLLADRDIESASCRLVPVGAAPCRSAPLHTGTPIASHKNLCLDISGVHLAINEEVRAMDVLFIGFGPFHVEAYGTLAIVVVALIVRAHLLGRGGRPR